MAAVSGPLRGPYTIMLTPQATQTYGLCTLGLFLFKAAGLVQALGLHFSTPRFQLYKNAAGA